MKSIETIYPEFENAVKILQTELNSDFTSAVVETFDNLENGNVKVLEGAPSEEGVAKLNEAYEKLNYAELSSENKQTMLYLLMLTAVTNDGYDENQQVTPKYLSMISAILAEKFVPDISGKTILDPAVGTGTLLLDVLNEYQANKKANIKVSGIDNNADLLDLADVKARLANQPIELYHQDTLAPWIGDAPDVVFSDLPVGYYPVDEQAKKFANARPTGHSMTHELMIEQIVSHLNENGFAFLVIPGLLLKSENATNFIGWLAKNVFLQAIIDLPDDLFAEQTKHKAIMVFQNHGSAAKQPKNVLLAKIGSLRKPESLVEFNYELNEWYKNNLG